MVAATTAYRTQNAKMGCYQSGPTYRKEPRNSAISRCFWAFNYIYACIKDCVLIDPCCGSGGMFCQSARFVREHQGNLRDISIFGQESNPTTWKLAKMNLAIRGLEANLGKHNADSFHDDQHKTLKANYILANPPFNISDWGGERLQDDIRWKYGVPPVSNANYAWLEHMLHHLNPAGGVCATILANGSLNSSSANEAEIRKNMVNSDVVECIVSLPGQLFYSTPIPVCLWIMRKGKSKEYSFRQKCC